MGLPEKLESLDLSTSFRDSLKRIHQGGEDLSILDLDDPVCQREIIDFCQTHCDFLGILIGKVACNDLKTGEKLYAMSSLRDQISSVFKVMLKNGSADRKHWCLRVIISCFDNVDSLATLLASLLHDQTYGSESLLALLKLKTDVVEHAVEEFVDDLLLQESDRTAFVTMTKVHYTMIDSMSKILLSESFSTAVARSISRGTNAEAILSLFSEASVREQNRKFIAEKYLDFIARQTKIHPQISSLVLAKLWNMIDIRSFQEKYPYVNLFSLLTANSAELTSDSIETLAYLTLKLEVKKHLRNAPDFIERCVNFLRTCSDQSMRYGVLTILTNVSQVFAKRSDLEKAVNSKEGDSLEEIVKFSNKLLDLKVVETFTQNMSKGCESQSIRLLFNLSYDKDARVEVIKQGGVNILLTFLRAGAQGHLDYSDRWRIEVLKPFEDPQLRFVAVHTLAKLLFYRDPRLIFIKTNPITSVVFLCEIVQDYCSLVYEHEAKPLIFGDTDITWKDLFEALHSLTNLASLEDANVNALISNMLKTPILQIIHDDCSEWLRREACGLLGNISANNVVFVGMFFNWHENPKSKVAFDQIVSILLSDDPQTLIGVLNFFCHVICFPEAGRLLAETESFITFIFKLLEEKADDLGIVFRCLVLLTEALGLASDKARRSFEGKEKVLNSVEATHNDEEITILVRDYLHFFDGREPENNSLR